jgi:hypothetical protein
MDQDDPVVNQSEVIEVGPLTILSTAPYAVRSQSNSGGGGDGADGSDGDGEEIHDVVGGPVGLSTQPYDPSRHRELLRGGLAISLVAILALTIFMSFLMIWPTRSVLPTSTDGTQQIADQEIIGEAYMIQDQQDGNANQPDQGTTAPPQTVPQGTMAAQESPLQELLTLIFTPVVGLVGAVTGFYFGGESVRARSGA